MLREQSLIAKLEEHKFLRRSFKGLREEHPTEYERFKQWYGRVEAYAELEAMVNKEAIFDRDYAVWLKWGEYAHMIERKALYSRTEVEVFSEKFGIPMAEFEEIANSTGTYRAELISAHHEAQRPAKVTSSVWRQTEI